MSIEYLLHIANLAKLKIPEDKIEYYREDLEKILSAVKQIQEVDTTSIAVLDCLVRLFTIADIAPLNSLLEHESLKLREDSVAEDLPKQAEILQNAKNTQAGYILVPKMKEDDSS